MGDAAEWSVGIELDVTSADYREHCRSLPWRPQLH